MPPIILLTLPRQCLLDQSPQIALSLSCPSCSTYLPQNNPSGASSTNPFRPTSQENPILTTYTNEGGTQTDLDILPILTEEAFLAANPFRPTTQENPILTTYTNEGGPQADLDILPLLTEEAFLAANPLPPSPQENPHPAPHTNEG